MSDVSEELDAGSSETSATFCQAARYHVSGNGNVQCSVRIIIFLKAFFTAEVNYLYVLTVDILQTITV
jgi:hypothetical protein